MKFKVLFMLLFAINIYSQEVIDKIVAVVDNEIIAQSELDFQITVYANQRKIDPETPGFKEMVLNSLIEEKLAYAQAFIDSIMVSDEEIAQRVDYQIDMFTQQYGSRENVEKVYNMSIEKIKRELRDNVKKSLMIQKLQEKNFAGVKVSKKEVEEFYNGYKDSIGVIPEKVKLSHIYVAPKPTEEIKKKHYDVAKVLLDSLKAGADFAELAKRNSEDPGSAVQGGDLGFVKRGSFTPSFEAAAYKLKVNEISEIIESPFGYHIIQLLEKRGDNIHTRHILVKFKNDEDADIRAITFLSDLRDSVVRFNKSFSEMAKKYSEDKETAVFGGSLGESTLEELDKNLAEAAAKLREGQVSAPKRLDFGRDVYGFHIVQMDKRIYEHAPTLEQDFLDIEAYAINYKKSKLYREWMENLKSKIFWETRL